MSFSAPSKDVNKIVGGVLARYQEVFQIEICAYAIMSRHPDVHRDLGVARLQLKAAT